MTEPTINLVTPAKWKVQWFGRIGRRRVYGCVLAICPTAFALGVEAITGESRGLGLMIGPLWIGFATLRIAA